MTYCKAKSISSARCIFRGYAGNRNSSTTGIQGKRAMATGAIVSISAGIAGRR
jgi:hypothetical protein